MISDSSKTDSTRHEVDNDRVEKTAEHARQGTSRQGVIYVLAASLLLAAVAAVALSIGYDFGS